MKKTLPINKSVSANTSKSKPENALFDESAFHGLDELRALLPMEESRLLILEDKYLMKDASLMIKLQKELFRTYRGGQAHMPSSSARPGRRQPKLSSTIDPEWLKESLLSMIEKDGLYLNEDLSLSSLARALNIEPHQLTIFLNRNMMTTFHDFINAYRVEAAKRLLENEPKESILEIAFRTGFNSKASFNRIFKKIAGTTPSRYRKEHSENRLQQDSRN